LAEHGVDDYIVVDRDPCAVAIHVRDVVQIGLPGDFPDLSLVDLERVLGVRTGEPMLLPQDARVLVVAAGDEQAGLVVVGRLTTLSADASNRLPLPALVRTSPALSEVLTNENGPCAVVLDGRRFVRGISGHVEAKVSEARATTGDPARAHHTRSSIEDSGKELS
jgi:hypothetical protein